MCGAAALHADPPHLAGSETRLLDQAVTRCCLSFCIVALQLGPSDTAPVHRLLIAVAAPENQPWLTAQAQTRQRPGAAGRRSPRRLWDTARTPPRPAPAAAARAPATHGAMRQCSLWPVLRKAQVQH